MKAVLILILAVIFMHTRAEVGDPKYTRGNDLINWIRGGMDGTFIVFFFDPAADNAATVSTRKKLNADVIEKNPHFHYYEIQKTDPDFAKVKDYFEIDADSLSHAPIILITYRGRGLWSHGDGAVSEIVENIPKYSAAQGDSKKSKAR